MSFFQQIKMLPWKVISALENEEIPFSNYLLTFFFAITLRNFAESYSQPLNYFNRVSLLDKDIIHFYLFYIMLAMLLISFFRFVTRSPLHKAARVVLPCFILLLLTPLLDLLFTRGQGAQIFYLAPQRVANLLHVYLTYLYLGGFKGASLGLKCEAAIVLIGCYSYFRVKGLNIILSLFYTWVSYSIIFALGSSTYFINWLLILSGFDYVYSSMMMIHFYLVGIFILSIFLFYLGYKKLFLVFIKDMRALRILHYQLMLILGVVIALTNTTSSITTQLHTQQDIVINIILCAISIFFAGLFSIIMNNLSDIAIDKISNADRPLISGEIDINTYKMIGYVSLAAAFFYAMMVGVKAFMLIGVTMASYFIYSMPPLRLKRITLFSKLAISLNSIALIVLGYLIVQDNLNYFPNGLFYIYFIGYTITANFIDLKDIEGDRVAGVITLPILLSVRQAKIIIGLGFWLTYVAFFYIIKNVYALPLLIAGGGIQFFLINKNPYREWQVLLLYNISILFLIFYLCMTQSS